MEEQSVLAFSDSVKTCPRCGKRKSIDDFYPRKPNGYHTATHRTWCKKCDSRAQKSSRTDAKKRYHKNYKLEKKFGINLAEYESILARQSGMCAICGATPDKDSMKHGLAVDHDHASGKVRGLLCRHCNIGLGKLGDNLSGLMRAVNYLKNSLGDDRL